MNGKEHKRSLTSVSMKVNFSFLFLFIFLSRRRIILTNRIFSYSLVDLSLWSSFWSLVVTWRAGCINTRIPLLEGCAGERIGTMYLRSGGTSPLKGASLIVGGCINSQSVKRETLKTPRIQEMPRLKHVKDPL